MWLRLAARADVGYLRRVDQAYYRRHPDNMSAAYTPLLTLNQYVLAFDSVLDRCEGDLADPNHLSALVRRKLAKEALLTAARAYDRGCAEQDSIDELLRFALCCWPAANRLALYRTLQLRRWAGPRLTHQLRGLTLPAAAARKAESYWLGLPAARPLLSQETWTRHR
jgi:hypothetical protein